MARAKKYRHVIFWKMSAILLMLLVMEGGMTGTALYLTYKLKGDANAINYAGHERWRTYDQAFLINEHFAEGADKKASRKLVEQKMKKFEEILYGLRDGNEALRLKGVKPPKHKPSHAEPLTPEAAADVSQDPPYLTSSEAALTGEEALWARMTHHINEYEQNMKPVFLRALNAPNAEAARAILSTYNLPEYVVGMNQTVRLFSDVSDRKVSQFQI
ncbi:MAG: type IV pili methyl-accepting chemotaxis transducer N-terminal domain-containing protein, partial [Candidatus Brocadiales bacterium]